jgi:phage protein U
MQLGSFGNIVFEASADKVRTWQKFQRKGAARFAEHPVLGGKPRLESLGPALDTIDLQIRLDSQLGLTPLAEIEALRTIKDSGEEQHLIIGGQPWGKFVLVDLNEDHVRHGKDGLLLLAIIDLQLKEYAE